MHPIDQALEIAIAAHKDRLDSEGVPTILHSIKVGMLGSTDEEKAAGFLHEVVSVAGMSLDYLAQAGIPQGIVNAVKVLTPKPGQSDTDKAHIQDIINSHNPIALQVKFNALQGNEGEAYEMVKAEVEKSAEVGLYTGPITPNTEVAIFAGGCFWGVQHAFEKLNGVSLTLVGYTGGNEEEPTYEDVRAHKIHHVEAVIVEYNPLEISYIDLCKLFFEIHDPAQVNGVGPDIGPQYRSCIFYRNSTQMNQAQEVIDLLRSLGYEVNTLLLPAKKFWVGEKYHQHYYAFTGGEPYCHVRERKFPRK